MDIAGMPRPLSTTVIACGVDGDVDLVE